MDGDESDLPLFTGPHIPRIRFQRALDRFDLGAAMADAPPELRDAVAAMATALEGRSPARADLDALLRCRRTGWPPVLERTWQRLVGRRLDAYGIPRTFDGEPAAAFLLRGGDRERARASLDRYLAHHPRRSSIGYSPRLADRMVFSSAKQAPEHLVEDAVDGARTAGRRGGCAVHGLSPQYATVTSSSRSSGSIEFSPK